MANFKAKKAGMALHCQRQAQEKYNELEAAGTPQRIVDWMNATLNGDHTPCAVSSWRKLQFYLRDGTALCKFLNKLRTAAGLPALKFQKNALTQFVALENIDSFTKGAEEYGVPRDLIFQNMDLYEGQKGPFLKIVVFLNKLGVVANEKGFSPRYESVVTQDGD